VGGRPRGNAGDLSIEVSSLIVGGDSRIANSSVTYLLERRSLHKDQTTDPLGWNRERSFTKPAIGSELAHPYLVSPVRKVHGSTIEHTYAI
jgi:hypothetical protein